MFVLLTGQAMIDMAWSTYSTNYIIKFSLNPGITVAGCHGTLVYQAPCDLGVLGGNLGDVTNNIITIQPNLRSVKS